MRGELASEPGGGAFEAGEQELVAGDLFVGLPGDRLRSAARRENDGGANRERLGAQGKRRTRIAVRVIWEVPAPRPPSSAFVRGPWPA